VGREARIYVDFQNSDSHGRVRLNTNGTFRDLHALGVTLSDQLPIIIYSEELEADARVVFSAEENIWVAQIDWQQVRAL
jgi:hypothetical protein